ncbi:MAG: carboxypeptidase-like regulatory domain-containing protein [bacterium]|nr:carboxypeptidase-like regulatory domain-containing protein [bacterium]
MSSSRRPSLSWLGLAALLAAAVLIAIQQSLQSGAAVAPHALKASAASSMVGELPAGADVPTPLRVAATPASGTAVVVDELGRPVDGARLFAHDETARHLELPTRAPESDLDGAVEIGELDPKAADHTCYHPDYQPASWNGEPRIVLRRGSEVHGQVRGLDGVPLAGVLVQLSRAGWDSPRDPAAAPPRVPTAAPRAVFAARTDDLGGFVVGGLPVGRYLLRTSHSRCITTDIDGQGRVAKIDAPCGGITVTMAPILGCRVEFGGEIMLSSSMLYPRGLRTGLSEVDRRLGRPSRSMAPQSDHFEYCGVPTPGGFEPMLVLYALLSESGPVRLDLPLRPIDDPEYTVVRAPKPGPIRTGRAHIELVDTRGREVAATVTLVGEKGVQLFEISDRNAAMNLDPTELKWGARLPANEPATVRAGRYRLMSRDPILGRGIAPRTFVAIADDLVQARIELPWPVAQVAIAIDDPASRWHLQVIAHLASGGRNSKTWQFTAERRVQLDLPPGDYRFLASSPGRQPLRHEVTVDGDDLAIDLGTFERR